MIKDILLFLKNLSFIDYVFFFTIVFLIILVITLIYFIKINEDIIEINPELNDPDNLQVIASSIKKESKPITFTSYEQEQEKEAIISYDELLSNHHDYKLNYVEEDPNDEVDVRQVDLSRLASEEKKTNENKIEVHLISLKKEEEFLLALKELQKLLN